MEKFRAPYRITTVYERLIARPELSPCSINIEELEPDREEGYFPTLQYDTARVFVRYKDYSVNVVGVLQESQFHYRANCYQGNHPWDLQFIQPMSGVDKLVELIVGKFDTVVTS